MDMPGRRVPQERGPVRARQLWPKLSRPLRTAALPVRTLSPAPQPCRLRSPQLPLLQLRSKRSALDLVPACIPVGCEQGLTRG